MNQRSNLEIVEEGYAAFGRGDIPALLDLMDANVLWDVAGPTEMPWAGSFRGHAGLQEFFGTLDAELDIETFEPRTFVADGDKVVVLGFEKARSKHTGRTYEAHWAHAFTLSGGVVTSFREFTDTAAAVGVCREKVTT